MKNVRDIFNKYFYIPPLDLADLAEKNRIRTYYLSWLALIGCAASVPFVVFMYRSILREKIATFVFWGICIIVNILSVILCHLFKEVDRKKAYVIKNIPMYMVFCWGMLSSVYNYYLQGSALIGVLTFFNAVLVTLCVFSLSVSLFVIFVLAGFCGMIPGLYNDFGLIGALYFFFITGLMLALAVFSRYKDKLFITAVKRQKKSLEIKTFGNFTPLYDKKVIKFARTKSNELLAYLIYKDGSSVNTKELLAVLYGDHADSARYGASLRLLISDIKHTFSELEIQNFFITEYNNFRINPEVVKCDYYDFLAGNTQAAKSFTGEFMSQYTWAEDKIAFLERKATSGAVVE